jgi:hypothetical protein
MLPPVRSSFHGREEAAMKRTSDGRSRARRRQSGIRLLLAVPGVLIAGACGGGDNGREGDARSRGAVVAAAHEGQEAAAPVTIELEQANGSGQSGTATLTDKGLSGTAVVLTTSTPDHLPGHAQPASINAVGCAELGPLKRLEARERTVAQVLREVRDGTSETTAARSLAELTTGAYSINVYAPSYPYNPVACGDIPAR